MPVCATAQDAPAPPPGPPPFQGTALAEGPWDFETAEADIHAEVLVRGLERPWGMAFLPEGGMLVTERVGRLRHIDASGHLDPIRLLACPPCTRSELRA